MSKTHEHAHQPPAGETVLPDESADDRLADFIADFERLGAIYRITLPGGAPSWVVADPDAIRQVLVSNHPRYGLGSGFNRIRVLVGDGIIVSEGETWKRQHRMLLPMFQRSQIERFADMIVEVNERRLAQWAALAERGEPLNITRETNDNALEVTLRAVFGADIDWLVQELGENPFQILITHADRDLAFAFRFRQLAKHVRRIIARRRASDSHEGCDWLGQMIAARDRRDGSPMEEQEMVDEIMSLIVAGHETTGATLNAVWYLLSQHPEAEARLHAEVDAVRLPDYSLASVETLSYTHQVIMEALRLYPPVWILSRKCTHATQLGGYSVADGTNIYLSPYLVQRDAKHWPEPERFKPERFADFDRAAAARCTFIPFAAGPRHCVGETMATYEMALHVYLAARRFRLALPAGTAMPMDARINLRAHEDVCVRVLPRTAGRG